MVRYVLLELLYHILNPDPDFVFIQQYDTLRSLADFKFINPDPVLVLSTVRYAMIERLYHL
jgi:hypothetical protein